MLRYEAKKYIQIQGTCLYFNRIFPLNNLVNSLQDIVWNRSDIQAEISPGLLYIEISLTYIGKYIVKTLHFKVLRG